MVITRDAAWFIDSQDVALWKVPIVPGGRSARPWVNPATGAAKVIDLGGATLANGDGILLMDARLYVVQNRLDRVAVVELEPRTFASGRAVGTLTSPTSTCRLPSLPWATVSTW